MQSILKDSFWHWMYPLFTPKTVVLMNQYVISIRNTFHSAVKLGLLKVLIETCEQYSHNVLSIGTANGTTSEVNLLYNIALN